MIVRRYPNQRYTTFFNCDTGFFLRKEDHGQEEPFWCHIGPELIDFAITNRCQRECAFCYRHSSSSGREVSLDEYMAVMEQAQSLGTLQVALGGGNPNEHPEFVEMLEATRRQLGIVPNYTTNGDGLTDRVLSVSAAHCGAVAVSYYEPVSRFKAALCRLISAGIKTNVHFLLSRKTVCTASEWIASPPSFLLGVNAVIFLTYKPHKPDCPEVEEYLLEPQALTGLLRAIDRTELPFKFGFDSCLVPAIAESTTFSPLYYEFCEGARFSMFVSENLDAYPCSFMTNSVSGVSLRQATLAEVWRDAALFREFRERIRLERCAGCNQERYCRGGCPVFLLNLCSRQTGARRGQVRPWASA